MNSWQMLTDDPWSWVATAILTLLAGLYLRWLLDAVRETRHHAMRTAAATEALLRELSRLRTLAEPHPLTIHVRGGDLAAPYDQDHGAAS